MSKIGRKPIDVSKVQVEISGQKIKIKGVGGSVTIDLPLLLKATLKDKQLTVEPTVDLKKENHTIQQEVKRSWGLYRALLSNHVLGLMKPFESELHINGLGFKAVLSGKSLTFTLGYSHTINFYIPENVTVEVDKTGQRLLVKSANKESVGKVCSEIKRLRMPEPYKGTGIKLGKETLFRKPGKTKAA